MAAKHLKSADIPHLVSTTRFFTCSYYPNAKQLTIQITFSPDTKQLLGAQVIGEEGRQTFRHLSNTNQNKGTIYDLMDVEHAYAPPYSS